MNPYISHERARFCLTRCLCRSMQYLTARARLAFHCLVSKDALIRALHHNLTEQRVILETGARTDQENINECYMGCSSRLEAYEALVRPQK